MIKQLVIAALLICPPVMADFLSGLQAHRNKDYLKAQHEFQALLPLGNAEAVYNLAAMAYHGEGQKADLVLAAAYFQLSAELGDETAQSQLPVVVKELTAAQQQQAEKQFRLLQSQVVITQKVSNLHDSGNNRTVIKHVEPDYPVAAARKNLSGYVSLRLHIDAAGKVVATDILNSFPAGVFDSSAQDAVAQWQYQQASQASLAIVNLSFRLGDLSAEPLEQWSQNNQLWTFAFASSAEHQQALGSLLHFLAVVNQDALAFSEQQPFAEKLPEQFFQRQNNSDGNTKTKPVVQLHPYYDYRFWWQKAAKNGNKAAQRYLAVDDQQWENYLLTQGDAVVQSWVAVRTPVKGGKYSGQPIIGSHKQHAPAGR